MRSFGITFVTPQDDTGGVRFRAHTVTPLPRWVVANVVSSEGAYEQIVHVVRLLETATHNPHDKNNMVRPYHSHG